MSTNKGLFTEGLLWRHVVNMTCTSATGMLAIFFNELLTVAYIALLHDDTLLAALVLAKTMMFFITSMVLGVAVATGTVVAKKLGAGATERARQLSTCGVLLTLAIAGVGAAAGWTFLDFALHQLGAEGDTLTAARAYLQITLPAAVLSSMGLICAQILRAAGLGKQAMWISLTGTAVIALADPLLILGCDLGLKGGAFAFVCSCTVTAILGLYYVHCVARLTSGINRQQLFSDVGDVAQIAIPAIFGNLATPVAVAYLISSIAHYGEQALAGFAVVDRIIQLIFCVFFALPGALSPIIGQNLGAGNPCRVRGAIRASYGLAMAYGTVVSLILVVSAGLFESLFDVKGEGQQILLTFCQFGGVLWTVIGLQFIATSIFLTLGKPLYVTLFGWLRASLGTIPFVWYGAIQLGSSGALLGQLIGNATVAVAACLCATWVVNCQMNASVYRSHIA